MDEEVLEQIDYPRKGFQKERNLQVSSGMTDIIGSIFFGSNNDCISSDHKSWKVYVMYTRKPKGQKRHEKIEKKQQSCPS